MRFTAPSFVIKRLKICRRKLGVIASGGEQHLLRAIRKAQGEHTDGAGHLRTAGRPPFFELEREGTARLRQSDGNDDIGQGGLHSLLDFFQEGAGTADHNIAPL
jgi:hypothetical protein